MKNLFIVICFITFAFASVINIPDDYDTIQMGIVFAANGDTVLVADGTYSGDGNVNIDFYGKAITLLAYGATISAGPAARAFNIHTQEDTTTVIDGFTISDSGAETAEGGAIRILENSAVKLKNCIFSTNNSVQNGGAIFIDSGFAFIENSTFNDNGSYTSEGGAIYAKDSKVIIHNSIFDHNYARSNGAAIFGSNLVLEIYSTDFNDNKFDSQSYNSGAIYFSNNTQFQSETTKIYDSNFSNNGSYWDGSGGAIEFSNLMADLEIKRCTFIDNVARGSGGAIYIYAGSEDANVYIEDSIFDDNGNDNTNSYYSTNQGGAIYFNAAYNNTLNISRTIFKNNFSENHSSSGYGTVFLYSGHLNIDNSLFHDNANYGIWSDYGIVNVNFCTSTNTFILRENVGSGQNLDTVGTFKNSIVQISCQSNYGDCIYENIPGEDNFPTFNASQNFLDYTERDLRHNIHSTGIGAGVVDDNFDTDLLGNPRVHPEGSNPDIGCYEHTLASPNVGYSSIYVDLEGDDDTGSGTFENPFKTISFAALNTKGVSVGGRDSLIIGDGYFTESETIKSPNNHYLFINSESEDLSQTTINCESNPCFQLIRPTLKNLSISGTSLIGSGTNVTLENIETNASMNMGPYATDINATNFKCPGIYTTLSEHNHNNTVYNFNYNLDYVEIDNIHFIIDYAPDYNRVNLNITNSLINSIDGNIYSSPSYPNNYFTFDISASTITDYFSVNTSSYDGSNYLRNIVFDSAEVYLIHWYYNNGYSLYYTIENATFYNSNLYSRSVYYASTIKQSIFWPYFSGYLDIPTPQNSTTYPPTNVTYTMNAPYYGNGNIVGNPLLNIEDFTLYPSSPCINAGNPSIFDEDGTIADLGANPYNFNGNYEPNISSIFDVPDDQGGQVRLTWLRSENDAEYGNIQNYGIWRVLDDGSFDGIGEIPALQLDSYQYIANTLEDSTADNLNEESFFITAHTPDPWIYYSSLISTGYSVDNIVPAVPENFSGYFNDNSISLSWDDNIEDDFQYYVLYLNDQIVAYSLDSEYIHQTDQIELNYKLTATDIHDNESESISTFILNTDHPLGDVNSDYTINVLDIIVLVNIILDNYNGGEPLNPYLLWSSDLYDDDDINIIDIVALVNLVMDINLN